MRRDDRENVQLVFFQELLNRLLHWVAPCIEIIEGLMRRGRRWIGSENSIWMIMVIKIAFIISDSRVCTLWCWKFVAAARRRKKCASVINSKSFRDRYRILRKQAEDGKSLGLNCEEKKRKQLKGGWRMLCN